MISWPPALVSDIARRRCVIVLGAGISRNSTNPDGRRPKTWEEFLRGAAESLTPRKHVKGLISRDDYLTACEVIKRKLGRDVFIGMLRDEFLTPGYQHAPIHDHIFALDSRIVATPNFDKIYETRANASAHGTIVLKHHYDPDVADIIREDGRLILKIHGSIDSPDRMIFTRSEYAKARSEYRSFYQILDSLAMTHTFLFLGCGTNDPDLKLLFEDVFFRHPHSRKHAMALPRRALHNDVAKIVEETMNLSIITYSSASNHQELTDSVQELGVMVENKRDELRRSGNW
ncbi:hypothetical protein LCGC14_2635940 [marine sediment metagenome]|uniref:Uncharacterized protein n=1 Tax=marine sediment metagenome TaxID=412755 RepID=A0A0F9C9S3_9ZZZZ